MTSFEKAQEAAIKKAAEVIRWYKEMPIGEAEAIAIGLAEEGCLLVLAEVPDNVTHDPGVTSRARVFVDGQEVPGEVVETLDREFIGILVPPDAETVEIMAKALLETPGDWPGSAEEMEWAKNLARAVIRALAARTP
jgi:hypothetical protein